MDKNKEYGKLMMDAKFGDAKTAKTNYLKALQIAEEMQDLSRVYIICCSLANTLSELKEFEAAEETLIKAVELKNKNHEEIDSVLSAVYDLAHFYIDRERPKDALKTAQLDTAFMEKKFGRQSFQYNQALISTAAIFGRIGKTEQCIQLFEEALNYFRNNHEPQVQKVFLLSAMHAYKNLGLNEWAESMESELAAINSNEMKSSKSQTQIHFDIQREAYESGEITKEELREKALVYVAGEALKNMPLQLELVQMMTKHGMNRKAEVDGQDWQVSCLDLITEFNLSEPEVLEQGRKIIEEMERSVIIMTSSPPPGEA